VSNLATFLQDVRGQFSSKRLIGIAALLGVLGNIPLTWAGHPLADHMLDVLATFVGGSLLGATAEHFTGGGQ
jgi:hypothetical protein